MYHEIHSIIFQEEDFEIRISLRLDGIFSYLPTRSLTPEDIEIIDHVESILLTLDSTSWDPYDYAYEEEEDTFIYHKGDVIYPQQQKIKIFDDQDVCDITVSAEQYDEAINQALDDNEIKDSY